MGCDPTQSRVAMDRIVATRGIAVRPQLLTAWTMGPKREISHRLIKVLSSTQAPCLISMPKAPLCIFSSII